MISANVPIHTTVLTMLFTMLVIDRMQFMARSLNAKAYLGPRFPAVFS
jgi:hypothetical protein